MSNITVEELLKSKRSLEIKYFLMENDPIFIQQKLNAIRDVVNAEQAKYPNIFILSRVSNLKNNDIHMIFSDVATAQYRLESTIFLQQDGGLIKRIESLTQGMFFTNINTSFGQRQMNR